MSDLGPKWIRLAPNRTNLRLFFRSDFSTFGSILKSAKFDNFGGNLTHFEPNSDIHGSLDKVTYHHKEKISEKKSNVPRPVGEYIEKDVLNNL